MLLLLLLSSFAMQVVIRDLLLGTPPACDGLSKFTLSVLLLLLSYALQVVIRDLLLGTPPACNGLLCELLGVDPAGPFANPRLVIAAVALFICSPLLLLRWVLGPLLQQHMIFCLGC
jgi:hypothetical protein